MALLILLLSLNNFIQAAAEGYPSPTVNIIYDKEAIIQNDLCFPVVVAVNGRNFMVKANAKFPMATHKWTSWSWKPGIIDGTINRKQISHPLHGGPKVSYGPEDTESHKGIDSYGYDFDVPIGTKVHAMEKGKVIRILQHYKLAHQDKKRMDENNTIEIMHEDGTVARYSHLKTASARVKHCEEVKVGQVLALSGNVGYSKGPHLHVDIIRPTDGESYRTIPLKFK